MAPLDGSLVKQAVLNLMLNAADAMTDASAESRGGEEGLPRELIIRTRPGFGTIWRPL